MSFYNSYKRLDNLCKQFGYQKGISSYIETMEQSRMIIYRCNGWDSDYKKLKNLRWKRTQISHVDDVYEETICEQGDEEWLENFRARVFNQTDPLGQYYKAQCASVKRPAPKIVKTLHSPHNTKSPRTESTRSTRLSIRGCACLSIGCGMCIALVCIFVFSIIWLASHI